MGVYAGCGLQGNPQVDCDALARGLASTSNFAKAVQSQDVKLAAETAVEALLKVSGWIVICMRYFGSKP